MTSPARTNTRYRYIFPVNQVASDPFPLQDTFVASPFLDVENGRTLVRTFMQGYMHFGYYITGMDAPYANPWWGDMQPWFGLQMTHGATLAPDPPEYNPAAGDDQGWIQSNPLQFHSVFRGDSANGPYEVAAFQIPQGFQETRANRLAEQDGQLYEMFICWAANNYTVPPWFISDTSFYSGFIQGTINVTLFFEDPA